MHHFWKPPDDIASNLINRLTHLVLTIVIKAHFQTLVWCMNHFLYCRINIYMPLRSSILTNNNMLHFQRERCIIQNGLISRQEGSCILCIITSSVQIIKKRSSFCRTISVQDIMECFSYFFLDLSVFDWSLLATSVLLVYLKGHGTCM